MKVQKNFLSKQDFFTIEEVMLSGNFPWHYNANIVNKNDPVDYFQFTHVFYRNNSISSSYFSLLNPILDKIKCLGLLQIKANLLTKTNTHVEHGFHRDYDNDKVTTGVFYINTNNGYTKFKNSNIERSEKNKYVEFKSKLLPTGASCTDENIRVVLNFNYVK